MAIPSKSRSASGRDLGESARRTTLLSLGAAALFYGVVEPDPIAAALVAGLLVLPRTFPLFRFFRLIDPTVAAGLLGAGVLLLPVASLLLSLLDRGRDAPWHAGLPWAVMLYTVWKFQHGRLTGRDHLVLLAAGLFLVVVGGEGSGQDWRRPLLVLWVLATSAALVRIHLSREEHRVLDLAGVRASDRADAREIGGRIPAFPPELRRSVMRIGFWLVCLGIILTWALPLLRETLRGAFEGLAAAEFDGGADWGEEEGPPEFEIPPGAIGLPPFGPRLERAEYLARRASESLALLERGGRGLPLVRGECYDFLDRHGRWVRTRRAFYNLYDAQDGNSDGFVASPFASGETGETIDYLLPPGPDRTIYSRPEPLLIRAPVLVANGTECVRVRRRDDSELDYQVHCRPPKIPGDARLGDPGPEFLLLPSSVSRERLERFAKGIVAGLTDPVARADAVRRYLRVNCLNLDEPPPNAEEETGPAIEAPEAGDETRGMDVEEFLFVRRWGDELDFASACCALLRALDIPCRLATGYRDGEWIFEGGFQVYRGFSCWAWVEVPLAGVGWLPIDPTPEPPMELDAEDLEEIHDLPSEERAEEAERRVEEAKEPAPSRNLFQRLEDFLADALGSRIGGRVLAWVLVLGAGTLLLLLFGFAGDRGRRLLFVRSGGSQSPTLPPFYERMLTVLSRHGLRRRLTQTPLEFASVAVRYLGPEAEDVRRLTNAFCAYRYGGADLPGSRQAGLMERVSRLDAVLEERRPGRRGGVASAGLWLLVVLLPLGIAVAQGADPSSLVEQLGDEHLTIRTRASKALSDLGPVAVPHLLSALAPEGPEADGREIRRFIRQLDSNSFQERELATEALMKIGVPAKKALEDALVRGGAEVRYRAQRILDHIEKELLPAAREREAEGRRRRGLCLGLLGAVGDGGVVEPIFQAAVNWPELRPMAVDALRAITRRDPTSPDFLASHPDPFARRLAVEVMARSRVPSATPILLRLLQDPDPEVRAGARSALLTPGLLEDVEDARDLLDDEKMVEARALLRSVLGRCPGHAEAGLLLVRLLEEINEFKEGVAVLDRLDLPKWRRDYRAAWLYLRAEDPGAALARLENLRREVPGHTGTYMLQALVLLKFDPPRVELALDRANRAAKEGKHDADAWALLGTIYWEHTQSPDRAIECLREACRLEPGNRRYARVLATYTGR